MAHILTGRWVINGAVRLIDFTMLADGKRYFWARVRHVTMLLQFGHYKNCLGGLVSSCRLDLHDEAGSPDCDIMPPQLLDKMQLQLSCQKWTTLIKMIEETCIYTITMDTMWIQLYMLLLLFVGFICGLKPHCHQPYLCITSYCSLTGAVHVLLYSISSHCGNNMAAT